MSPLPQQPTGNSSNVEETEESALVEAETNEMSDEIASLPADVRETAIRLLQLIMEEDCTEILMNGPEEILFKKGGQRYIREDIKFPSVEMYHNVINMVILPNTNTSDRINSDSFLIEGQLELPYYDSDGSEKELLARVHIVAPPAVDTAKVTIAKKAKQQFNLDQLTARGSMSPAMASFLKAISQGRVTIVFSGLSGSGKTTLLEAMSHYFDDNDRVIVAEDTPELRLPLDDIVYLQTTTSKPGQDSHRAVTLEWLVSQANRMRPDRIIVGEVRGGEMLEFLSAANSGADGSMTTLHASSPRQALDKMLSLAMKSNNAKNESSVVRDISSTVQVVVQTALIDGRHIISAIEEISNTVRKDGGTIASTTLFEYNRSSGFFETRNRPTEQLVYYLAQRGVALDNTLLSRGV